ncbi:MAG TPA: RsmB/NOP family class I SAM-dependent RNA methyltransferase [Kofleriaceae bacterium]|nr:RsmB/NOP family class I SAM-dependent RNA methyltransferase [Kofleriaceae bacterium]
MDDRQLAAQLLAGGRLRALVLELWQRTRMDWGFVTDRLAQAFRKEKWLGAHERRLVGELLYGMVRQLRRIDLALTLARGGRAQAPRDLERLVALLVLDGLVDAAQAAAAVPELDWRAAAGVDAAIARERSPVARLALACSLPDWLAARLVADWGDEAEPLARALDQRAPMTVRANLLVGDRAALAAELVAEGLASHPGAWCDTALVLDTRTNLFSTAAFQRGAFEAQDEGSQLLADLVVACAPRDKPLIVDYCAGAGGKTLAIAARRGNRGRIVATDIDEAKLEELRRRARRATVSNARALHVDARELDPLRGKADVVLVDAPCSGTGALRRNPEARWRLRESDLTELAARQRAILAQAAQLCAPTGRVVYATCSVIASENAATADGFRTVPLRELWGEARAGQLGDGEIFTVTPHRHGTDGFFARVLQRA